MNALRKGYHSPQLDVEVRLNTNESPWPPPDGFTQALSDAITSTDFNRYPDREAAALTEALARHLGVEPNQVLCTNGSNEAILLLLNAFGGPGRKAAVFEPTYALHSHLAALTRTTVVTGERRPDTFALETVEVKRLLSLESPEVVFSCQPNNPTGNLDDLDVLQTALQSAGLVISDEAYGEFTDHPSAIDLMAEASNLAMIGTFSKAWGLAGMRIGYLVGSPELVDDVRQWALPYHLDVLKQTAARLALGYRQEMAERVAAINAERDRVYVSLSDMALTVWPSASNFILFRPDQPAGDVWQALADRSILIRDLSGQPQLDNCLRVTVGTETENDRFLQAMNEVLS